MGRELLAVTAGGAWDREAHLHLQASARPGSEGDGGCVSGGDGVDDREPEAVPVAVAGAGSSAAGMAAEALELLLVRLPGHR